MKLTKSKLKQIIKEAITDHWDNRDKIAMSGMAEPFSDEEQAAHSDAYYELRKFLLNSSLPGDLPSEKLHSALRWLAKFEEGT